MRQIVMRNVAVEDQLDAIEQFECEYREIRSGATWEYQRRLKEETRKAADRAPLAFEIDSALESKLLITVAPDGYLRRV